ncbi:hypothetical protein [Streptomyces sp. NPDC047070]|uniref:hypothetical protein n=1 Tax=Streptomyces sp. NPDC047070 TaxID=3154923 RepID=UPI0034567D9A
MPSKPGPRPSADYKPSTATLNAIAAWNAYVEEEARLREAAQAAIAADLKADPDLPVKSVGESPKVPWGVGMIQKIVTKYGVPPRQPNKAKKPDES